MECRCVRTMWSVSNRPHLPNPHQSCAPSPLPTATGPPRRHRALRTRRLRTSGGKCVTTSMLAVHAPPPLQVLSLSSSTHPCWNTHAHPRFQPPRRPPWSAQRCLTWKSDCAGVVVNRREGGAAGMRPRSPSRLASAATAVLSLTGQTC